MVEVRVAGSWTVVGSHWQEVVVDVPEGAHPGQIAELVELAVADPQLCSECGRQCSGAQLEDLNQLTVYSDEGPDDDRETVYVERDGEWQEVSRGG